MSAPREELRGRRERMLLRLLFRMFRAMNDETVRRTLARGHAGLQPAYIRLLGNVDVDGTRVNGLAQRMGVTRQAASQLIDDVERMGCLERCPDPDDRRAVIVRFTPKGRRMLADGMEVMLEIEAEYAAVIGKAELRRLKDTLAALAEAVDAGGTLGL